MLGFPGHFGAMIERGRDAEELQGGRGATSDALSAAGILYDAALNPELWPVTLASLAGRLAAPAALLRTGSGDRTTAGVLAIAGLEPAAVLACGAVDPTRDPLCEAAERHIGEPIRTGAEVSLELVANSEFGRLVLAPAGLGQALGVALHAVEGAFASLWFFRPREAPFTDEDARTLATWLPHLLRAVQVQHRLSAAEHASAASSAALDRLALGAIMVDERAHPLMVNRLADRLLAAGDGLTVAGESLRASTPAATGRLHAAIREVCREAAACGRTRSAGLRLARPAHAVPLDVIVVSLSRSTAPGGGRHPAAIVFIADPERTHVTPERMLRDLYDLTPAEARLAMGLAHGRSLTAAAAHVGISRNTAHTQLSSIFAKTGTTTQTELVRLIHRGPAAIRPYEDSADLRPSVEPGNGGESENQ
ncbi:MAG: helix-turn-helix transcriptional regulator [Acidobacteriota bacterium]